MKTESDKKLHVLHVVERGTQQEYVQIITESIDSDATTIRAQPMDI